MVLCELLFLRLQWLIWVSVVASSQEKSRHCFLIENGHLPYRVKIRGIGSFPSEGGKARLCSGLLLPPWSLTQVFAESIFCVVYVAKSIGSRLLCFNSHATALLCQLLGQELCWERVWGIRLLLCLLETLLGVSSRHPSSHQNQIRTASGANVASDPGECVISIVGQIADILLPVSSLPPKKKLQRKCSLEAFEVKILLPFGYSSAFLSFVSITLLSLCVCLYTEQSWEINPCVCLSFGTVFKIKKS